MLVSNAKWEDMGEIEMPEWMSNSSELSPITKNLLLQRGINTEEAVTTFLSPNLEKLHNPLGLSMMEKAVERVHLAINQQESILVYGDYDADGVSSTTLLLKALQELGANYDFYIPNRFTEGYGPNEEAFRRAHKEGFKVIITVDNGIAAINEAVIAKELGLDLIITDHHEVQEELPDAYAIINPKCSPKYEFHDLAGVGVAFKFAEHLLGYFPKHLLDLVAIGTIADLVPLIDENRVLSFFGLQELTNTKNIGIRALKKVCKIDETVTEEDVGFLIGPRINAVGRIKDASLAVNLLMSENEDEASEIAEEIQSINEERQQIVSEIVKEAEEIVELDNDEKIIIVAKKGWNEGVLGIVASRLVRKYQKPAIVLTIKAETLELKGSARSIPAFNLFDNCMKIRKLFTHFGGHSQAAGMTFPLDNLAEIKKVLNESILSQLELDDYQQQLKISQTLKLTDINEKLVTEINKLAPFGMANLKPLFKVKEVPTDVRQIGNLKKHLKLQFRDKDTILEGIGFSMGHLYKYFTPHTAVSIIGELGINEWNGNRKVQVVMQDMRINEWQLFDHRGKKEIDIAPYIKDNKYNLIVSRNNVLKDKENYSNIKQITYDTNTNEIEETDVLYIFDLPNKLIELEEIIKASKPKNIHVCFYVEDSAHLNNFLSRDAFKWYYGLILKHKKLDLKKELSNILKAKSWTKERLIFMTNVFLELKFIEVNDSVVEINTNVEKQSLEESTLYKQHHNEAEIEKELYYSNYEQLKSLFSKSLMETEVAKEAVTNGL